MMIAHNSGYVGYWELRRAIWDSSEPLVVKALALAIMEHMRPDNFEAYPTRERLARMCGISDKTMERHWGAITQWIDIIKSKGKVNVYRARIYQCASELIELLPIPTATPHCVRPPQKVPPIVTGTSGRSAARASARK